MTVDIAFLARQNLKILEELRASRIEMRAGFAAMDARFRDLEGRFADLEAKVIGMDLRLGEIHMEHDTRLAALEAKL